MLFKSFEVSSFNSCCLLLVALKSFGSPEANHPVLAAIRLTPEAPEQFFRFSQNCDGGLCKALYS